MLRFVLIFCLALTAPALATAQERQSPPDPWVRSNQRVTLPSVGVSFPEQAGAVRLQDTLEFSREGQGLDNGLQYISSDREIFATAYVYLPGLAHAGLTAFATNEAVRSQSANALRAVGSNVVAAGGHEGVAIRSDYSGFRGNLASSAAFIQAGRWMVKIRVSGPDARIGDVRATMSALLEGVRFDDDTPPRRAAILQVADCPYQGPAARALAGNYEQLVADAVIAATDGAGIDTRDETGARLEPSMGRVGNIWCVSSRARIGEGNYPILRARPGQSDGLLGNAVLLVPINDAGTTLELVQVERGRRFALMFHEIGRTMVLGSYDRTLTDEQAAAMLSGADREGGRIRTTVQIRSNGDTEMVVPPPPTSQPGS